MAVAGYVKCDVNPLCIRDSGIDLVREPVLRDLLLNHAHIPRIFRAEISAAPCDSKSALRAGCAKRPVRAADRTALPERHLVAFGLGFGWRALLSDGLLLFLRLDLGVLALNLDRIRRFLFDLGLRLGDSFRLV